MTWKALISGSTMLFFSTGLAVAQTATPACIGSQNTNCVPSAGVNGTSNSGGTMLNPNGTTQTLPGQMLPGQSPNGLRTAPGSTGLGTGTGPGVGTGTGLGSSTVPGTGTGTGLGTGGTGTGTGMGATPGAGGASGGIK